MEQASGPVSANAALLLGNVGFVLHQQGRPADAVPFFRRTVERRRQVHGDSSMHVAWPLFALGEALRDLGHLGEAEAAHRESVALRRALRPADHLGLARVLADQGRYDEAIAAFEEALPIYRTYCEGNLHALGAAAQPHHQLAGPETVRTRSPAPGRTGSRAGSRRPPLRRVNHLPFILWATIRLPSAYPCSSKTLLLGFCLSLSFR